MEELFKYNHDDYPNFTYSSERLQGPLLEASRLHGEIIGRFRDAGIDVRNEAVVGVMTDEIVYSARIEGDSLDREDVRDSIRKSMGLGSAKSVHASDGYVEILMDSVSDPGAPLSNSTLFRWHRTLFANGNLDDPGMPVGAFTDERMVIRASGGKVVYMGPPVDRIRSEMNGFMMWFNSASMPAFIKAGIAHLWFEIIHPFGDGNGRIGRAIVDRTLAREFESSLRTVGLSHYIAKHKREYYAQLEFHSKGHMDVTDFLVWFIESISGAIRLSNDRLDSLLKRDKFWARYKAYGFNGRQRKVIDKLLGDDFDAVITTERWCGMTKTSKDSARRDIMALVELGALVEVTDFKRNKKFRLGV
ncbi:cell division protein Fic (plasmid) [Fulvitalea axinellae]|uniref:Cell division protein Fic n=1 Tax=Fulvitalea axinellae TaxID=1182444 RepID=A0AAU9DP62_9BACT|nr:cell division protein Fic [Fulvitalea axinellae]